MIVLKTIVYYYAANVKLEYETGLGLFNILPVGYLMRPIKSKLSALLYVLIYN